MRLHHVVCSVNYQGMLILLVLVEVKKQGLIMNYIVVLTLKHIHPQLQIMVICIYGNSQ